MFLTADKERDLMTRAKAGDQRARDRLVLAHKPLVQRIAAQLERDPDRRTDAVQSGIIGLLKAIDAFDPTRGARLGTVATFWIRAELLGEYVRGNGPIALPGTAKRVVFKLPRIEREIRSKFPDLLPGEVTALAAAALDIDLKSVHGIRAARVRRSLDAPIADDDDAPTLGDTIADDATHPDEVLDHQQRLANLRKLVGEAIEQLSPRDRDIFVERVLCDENRYRLRDIAEIYNLSFERVRQIEHRSLEKVTKYVRDHSPHETAAA